MYARWLREDGCMRASSTPGLLVSLRPTDATVRALLTLRACATVVILAAASEALTGGHVLAYLILGEMRNARQAASRPVTATRSLATTAVGDAVRSLIAHRVEVLEELLARDRRVGVGVARACRACVR